MLDSSMSKTMVKKQNQTKVLYLGWNAFERLLHVFAICIFDVNQAISIEDDSNILEA